MTLCQYTTPQVFHISTLNRVSSLIYQAKFHTVCIMKHVILPQSFFIRDTITVAKELLGKTLVYQTKQERKTLIISEIEAYDGPHDKASHAHRGMTPRNKIMFDEGGFWYVYLIYGMYWMLNITTGPKNYPAAILIRGGYTNNILINGPGKITKYLNINKSINELLAQESSHLWIEDRGLTVPPSNIIKKTRVGVHYAKEWAIKPYNFSFDIPIH